MSARAVAIAANPAGFVVTTAPPITPATSTSATPLPPSYPKTIRGYASRQVDAERTGNSERV